MGGGLTSGPFLNAGCITYSISIFYFTFYLFGRCVHTQRIPCLRACSLRPLNITCVRTCSVAQNQRQCAENAVSPRLWNQLPASLRQPRSNLSSPDSSSPLSGISSLRFHRLTTPTIHHPSPSFSPGLKPFLQILPIVAFLFFFCNRLHGFPGLFTDTSEHTVLAF